MKRAVIAGEVAFVGALVNEVPDLLPLLQEHLDAFGELLPHIWMADVTRWAVQKVVVDPADQSLLNALQLMDRTLSQRGRDSAEHELVAASFVENLSGPGDPGQEIAGLLGPALRSQLELCRTNSG